MPRLGPSGRSAGRSAGAVHTQGRLSIWTSPGTRHTQHAPRHTTRVHVTHTHGRTDTEHTHSTRTAHTQQRTTLASARGSRGPVGRSRPPRAGEPALSERTKLSSGLGKRKRQKGRDWGGAAGTAETTLICPPVLQGSSTTQPRSSRLDPCVWNTQQ